MLIQGCLSLVLAVLCGMNLLMALSNSHVISSQSWFTGVEKLNLTVNFCQTQKYVSLALPSQPFCRGGFFLGSAYFLMV